MPQTPTAEPLTTQYNYSKNLYNTPPKGKFHYLLDLNGFSEKVENHLAHLALHYMHYHFGRIHQTLRVTPAMEAGVTDHVWPIEEIGRVARTPSKRMSWVPHASGLLVGLLISLFPVFIR